MSTGTDQELPGPKPTRSLSARGSPLSAPRAQLAVLSGLALSESTHGGDFEAVVRASGENPLTPGEIDIFQINVGKLCNMTCLHCHVDAGPDKKTENMDRETIDFCLAALDKTQAAVVDITGGAPELNPHFRYLVDQCRARGKHVMDRCNLTVLLIPRHEDLPGWFADRGVEVVCSLPHYRKTNTDVQRGDGTFDRSLEALRRLNAVGYGREGTGLQLTLVANPAGAYLSGNQSSLEREWKEGLNRNFGITFTRLILINNMPISRFLDWLQTSGNTASYMEKLVNAYNPATVKGLMCRNTISVGWDGSVYDCDFNQMLELPARPISGGTMHVRDFEPDRLRGRSIVTARHCFGCTAGSGSSCGGSLA